MIDQKTIDVIKSTIPVLKERGTEITQYFYKIMFENNPEVKPMFNMDRQKSGEQPLALAQIILAAAQNIDQLDKIKDQVDKIAKTHTKALVKAEHYSIVGENLLKAIKHILGDVATDEIMNAWEKAYGILAEIFINVEKEIYEKMELKF